MSAGPTFLLAKCCQAHFISLLICAIPVFPGWLMGRSSCVVTRCAGFVRARAVTQEQGIVVKTNDWTVAFNYTCYNPRTAIGRGSSVIDAGQFELPAWVQGRP